MSKETDEKEREALKAFLRPLLEFLLAKTDKRYPRLNAFCDLLSRGKNSPSTVRMHSSTVTLDTGQFMTTITELAETWQWQRATVRAFLNALVDLGYIRMTSSGKSYIFTILV